MLIRNLKSGQIYSVHIGLSFPGLGMHIVNESADDADIPLTSATGKRIRRFVKEGKDSDGFFEKLKGLPAPLGAALRRRRKKA